MNARAPSPFSPRAALALVSAGAALLVLVLWLVGSGLAHGPLNDGGSHGASKGLTGYGALAQLLERRGWEVGTARTPAELKAPGLLVLTPPAEATGADLARAVDARRMIGPTIVVTPKWRTVPLDRLQVKPPGAQPGWSAIDGTALPEWKGFLDDVGVGLARIADPRWQAGDRRGTLPDGRAVLSGSGPRLVPLVTGAADGRVLAARIADTDEPGETGTYPLIVVFEPDLIDNYGLAHGENALLALRLLDEARGGGSPRAVVFDLTFNGLARAPNLLTLAFTPPFLAATLCLLIAALIAGWRAFCRFGPPLASLPGMAPGKAQLVANAGSIVRRSGRLHLLGPPYAALVRERLAAALALPRQASPAATEEAIDRALAGRDPAAPSFSATALALRAARRRADLLGAAQALAALERKLKR